MLSSQAAAISTVLGLLVLRERMSRGQRLGFAMIIVAVTALAAGFDGSVDQALLRPLTGQSAATRPRFAAIASIMPL